MSNERDELANLLGGTGDRFSTGNFESIREWSHSLADTILAAGYRKIIQQRYGVFRVSDPIGNTTPMENMFFDTAKRAQSWIDNGYLQPEMWEVRAQTVGPWEPLP